MSVCCWLSEVERSKISPLHMSVTRPINDAAHTSQKSHKRTNVLLGQQPTTKLFLELCCALPCSCLCSFVLTVCLCGCVAVCLARQGRQAGN